MTRLFALLGPTASGKSLTAIELARRLEGEVISVDSMQVYRGMDIGTAKPTVLERAGVVHHMIDIADPEDEFTVAEYRAIGRRVMQDSEANALLIAGGSGLHFRALVDPMSFAPTDPVVRAELEAAQPTDLVNELTAADPDAADHVDLANLRRVIRAVEIVRLTGETPTARASSAEAERIRRYESEFEFVAAGIDPGDGLGERAARRVEEMRRGGLLEEVRRLSMRLGRTARSAVGYKELLPVIDGKRDLDEAFSSITANTLRLARRQRTWFQRDPRIKWIPWQDRVDDRVDRLMEIFDA